MYFLALIKYLDFYSNSEERREKRSTILDKFRKEDSYHYFKKEIDATWTPEKRMNFDPNKSQLTVVLCKSSHRARRASPLLLSL